MKFREDFLLKSLLLVSFLINYLISLNILCINLFLSLILSSRDIMVSVLETPSISSIINIISLAWLVSLDLTLQKY